MLIIYSHRFSQIMWILCKSQNGAKNLEQNQKGIEML